MMTGNVRLLAQFPKIEFEKIELDLRKIGLPKASLYSSAENDMILDVKIKNVASIEDGKSIAEKTAQHIANLFSYRFNIYCDFRVQDYSFSDAEPNRKFKAGDIIYLSAYGDAIMQLGKNGRDNLQEHLEAEIDANQIPYFEMFRSTMAMNETISKFMLLYFIALSICNDRQEKVDKKILRHQPSTPTNEPYGKRKTPETIYTRLRNEIGHRRPGTSIEGTRKEMQANLNGLMNAVKYLIEETK
jgi:hypothetical protein